MSSEVNAITPVREEIDLFDLCQHLWRKKRAIVCIMLPILIIGICLALFIPKTYKSDATVTLANASQLTQANLYQPLYSVSPQAALDTYYKVLSSTRFLQALYKQSGLDKSNSTVLSSTQKQAYHKQVMKFKKRLAFDKKNDSIRITYQGAFPHLAQDFINKILLPLAQQQTNSLLTANLKSAIYLEREHLINDIQQTQQNYIAKQQQEIMRLSQALAIAREAGIDSSYKPKKMFNDVIINNDVLFLLGTKVLSSKLTQAKKELNDFRYISKKSTVTPLTFSDKPLVAGVEDKYNQLVYLDNLHPDLSSMQPVNIINPASFPEKGSPSSEILVITSVILGLFLGVLVALIIIAREQRQTALPLSNKSHRLLNRIDDE